MMTFDGGARLNRILLVLLLPAAVSACELFSESWTPTLGVPYVAQEQFNYCVPASIAMWRAYDGLPPVSQDDIWTHLGGAPCDGIDASFGVRHYTNSGSDAFLDVESPSRRDDFLARQLTSIDRRVPVMAIVSPSRDHVGIINGGSYQYTGSTGRYTWNTVRFHDPGIGPNVDFSSNEWISFTCADGSSHCGQIISESASLNWASHVQAYGSSVDLYTGPCCTQEYQN
jgi:hypothetical protein